MTLPVDQDLLLADNNQTVTVTVKRSAGDTQIEVAGALKRALNRPQESFSGVVLQGNELVWNIPNEGLSGDEIEPGDTITEDAIADIDANSVVWTVLTVAKLTFGTRWRAVCRKQR